MANTYVDYTAVASQTDYNFSFEYLQDDHVKVKVDGTLVTNYTIVTSPTPTKIRFNTAPTAGAAIKIYRDSRGDFSPLVDFEDGSVLTQVPLDLSYKHNLFVSQESSEGTGGEQLTKKGLTNYDAEGNKIINLGSPTTATDAATKSYVDQTIDNAELVGGSPATVSLGVYDVTSTNDTLKQLRAWTADIETNASNISNASNSNVTATGSTTARSLATRFADVVNVLDYGATGDGTTDDTTAIQAALDKVKSNGGGICYFPKGTYSFTTLKLENASDVSLEGEAGTVLKTTTVLNSTSADLPLTFNVCDNLEIKNLTISGSTGATTGTSEGLLRIFNSDHVTLMGLKFLTTGGYTVVPLQSDYLTVTQCFFNQGSLWTQGCSYSKYTNNNFLDTTYDSLKIGAYIPDITQSTTIYSDHVVISNNVFNGSDNDAIDTYTRGFDLIIDGNIIKGASAFGIQMKTIIRDPVAYGDGGSSDVHGYNRKVIVSNNQISECGDYGLTVKHDDLQALVAGNFQIGQTYEIVTVGTTDFTLIGSADNNIGTTFTATGAGTGTGTAVNTSLSTDDTANYPEYFSIIGNTIVGSGASTNAGVYLRDVWKVLVSDNIVKNCDYGIQVGEIAYHININSNFVDDCVTSGIYAASNPNEHISINNNEVIGSATGILARVKRSSVCGNVISECTSTGLSLLFGDRTAVCNNVVSSVTDGVTATTGIGINITRFARCTIANNIAVNNDNGFKFTASATSDSTDGIVLGNLSSSNTTSDIIDAVTTTNFTQANNTFTI